MGITLSTLGGLSPAIQVLVAVALFAILVMAACSRKAAINLVAFLRDLGRVGQESSGRRSGNGGRHARNHRG